MINPSFFKKGEVYQFCMNSGARFDARIIESGSDEIRASTMTGEYRIDTDKIEFAIKYNEDPFKVREARKRKKKEEQNEKEE